MTNCGIWRYNFITKPSQVKSPLKLKNTNHKNTIKWHFQKNVDKRREERGASERERSGGRRHYVGGRELDRRARRHRESARDRDRDRNKEDRGDRDRGKDKEREKKYEL